MNSVIIVAAGVGKRFGAEKPKQFLAIHGKPIIIYTLEKFENCRAIDEIVLVLSAAEIENFRVEVEKYQLRKLSKIVAGGESRAASVANGLREIDAEKTRIVAVHDGARPLVSSDEIERVIEKAEEIGAACLVGAVNDTIKEIAGEKIVRTIERRNLRRALTPQAFRVEILKKAFARADLSEAATDECFLVEKIGVRIGIVEGSAKNIKITHAEDLRIAEMFLAEPSN